MYESFSRASVAWRKPQASDPNTDSVFAATSRDPGRDLSRRAPVEMSLGAPQSAADRIVQVSSLLGFGIAAVVYAHQPRATATVRYLKTRGSASTLWVELASPCRILSNRRRERPARKNVWNVADTGNYRRSFRSHFASRRARLESWRPGGPRWTGPSTNATCQPEKPYRRGCRQAKRDSKLIAKMVGSITTCHSAIHSHP